MLGRFRYDLKDKIKTQMESDAVQPCKLYFHEVGSGGQASTQWGEGERREEERERERKKERSKVRQP